MSKIDFEKLTLDEVETIENLTGGSIDKIADNATPKGKNLKAIIFVMMRRTDPSFTMEQAGQFTLTQAMEMFAPDPKE
jgi:hypothetical protein